MYKNYNTEIGNTDDRRKSLSRGARYLVVFFLGFVLSSCQHFIFYSNNYTVHQTVCLKDKDISCNTSSSPSPSTARTKPKIACNILTVPETHYTRLTAVNITWAPRCYVHHYFYSSETDYPREGVGLNVPDGRKHLTAKVLQMFHYSFNTHGDSVDWYLKADDDTYIIMENLQYLLSQFDPNKPYYIGQKLHFKPKLSKGGYHSGGAGYALSREAARRLVTQGMTKCKHDGTLEDVYMGACMKKLGVTLLHAIDTQLRMSFHYYNPMSSMDPNDRGHKRLNYRGIIVHPNMEAEALSVSTATMHYISAKEMLMFDFLIYDLCLWGRRDCKPASYSSNLMQKLGTRGNHKIIGDLMGDI